MSVEKLIYFYIAVCISMIIFNCLCILLFRFQSDKIDRRSTSFATKVKEQIAAMGQGNPISPRHLRYLQRKLLHISDLMAFDETLTAVSRENPRGVAAYIRGLHTVFLFLTIEYEKKERIKTAYLAYFMGKYKVCRDMPFDPILDQMESLLTDNSLYCRENALLVLYSGGNIQRIAEALKTIDRGSFFHHPKLLTDGLLTFEGDKEMLADTLWRSFGDFHEDMQVAILNFIRFFSPLWGSRLLPLLQDKRCSDEVRFACIRYFGRYPTEEAYTYLLSLALGEEEMRWEYAAISLSSLAAYPYETTIKTLKTALYSPNWYIRYNATDSLERLGVPYSHMMDVVAGDDRYAREMVQYRYDLRNILRKDTEGRGISDASVDS